MKNGIYFQYNTLFTNFSCQYSYVLRSVTFSKAHRICMQDNYYYFFLPYSTVNIQTSIFFYVGSTKNTFRIHIIHLSQIKVIFAISLNNIPLETFLKSIIIYSERNPKVGRIYPWKFSPDNLLLVIETATASFPFRNRERKHFSSVVAAPNRSNHRGFRPWP